MQGNPTRIKSSRCAGASSGQNCSPQGRKSSAHGARRPRKTKLKGAMRQNTPTGNHPKLLSFPRFRFTETGLDAGANHRLMGPSRPIRGAFRERHGRWVRDAVDAAASGAKARTYDATADGEAVWF
jgi:hypothetical protein